MWLRVKILPRAALCCINIVTLQVRQGDDEIDGQKQQCGAVYHRKYEDQCVPRGHYLHLQTNKSKRGANIAISFESKCICDF